MPDQPKKTPPADFPEDAAMSYDPDAEAAAETSAIEDVRRRHERTLLDIPGVTGIGIGRSPIGDDAIVVYLRDASVGRQIPKQLEGYAVQTTVTGEIDAQRRV